jgi:hypothetical protein
LQIPFNFLVQKADSVQTNFHKNSIFLSRSFFFFGQKVHLLIQVAIFGWKNRELVKKLFMESIAASYNLTKISTG